MEDVQGCHVLGSGQRRVGSVEVFEHLGDIVPLEAHVDRAVVVLDQADCAAGLHPGPIAHRLGDDDLALRPDLRRTDAIYRDPITSHDTPLVSPTINGITPAVRYNHLG